MPTSISGASSYSDINRVTSNGTQIVDSSTPTVNQNMFLKLLVAQITNQDPFSSDMDPTQYITQLAQFTQLEQMQQFNSNLNSLSLVNNGILINSALSTATTMIGKEAEFYSTDENSKPTDTIKGTVKSVYVEDGSVFLELEIEGKNELQSVRYDTFIRVTEKNNK